MSSRFTEFEDLQQEHGTKMAEVLFDELKQTPPKEPVDTSFGQYIVDQLPVGMAVFDRAEWGLESEDSDSCVYWCEHYYLKLPTIGAVAFVEVGDSHYYVNILRDCEGDGWWDNLTCKHQEDVFEYITDMVETISINDQNTYKSGE